MSCWAWLCDSVPETYWAGMPDAHQRHAEAAHVEGVAGVDQSVPRTAQRTEIRVVADVVFQEVENLLRVIIELGRFLLDVGIGGVGVRRGGEQAGIADIARLQHHGRRRIGDGPGVERGESLGANVELQGTRGRRSGDPRSSRQRDAGPVVTLDRAEAPGQVLAALVRQLRGALVRDAGLQRIGQQDAGFRRRLLVVDGVGDGFLVVLHAADEVGRQRPPHHERRRQAAVQQDSRL